MTSYELDAYDDGDEEDESDWKSKCNKKLIFGCVLFAIGVVLFAISVKVVIGYHQWQHAMSAQCQYVRSIAVECRGSRSCHGYNVGHEYAVNNDSDAFETCSAVIYVDASDACVCGTAKSALYYEVPSNADGDWHECYVKSCDSVHFEALYTESRYASSLAMFVVGVALVCASLCLCAASKHSNTPNLKTLQKLNQNASETAETEITAIEMTAITKTIASASNRHMHETAEISEYAHYPTHYDLVLMTDYSDEEDRPL